MFGYVTPCKMELKIKDFEKFKAYYCGLCKTIKADFGNIPRLSLNYDMTFLALLLDSLKEDKNSITKQFCAFHPLDKRVVLLENSALKYAAFCNVLLTYHKLLDNFNDENSVKSKLYASFLNVYLKKSPKCYNENANNISYSLKKLYEEEQNSNNKTLDEISHHFAHLTGYILSSFEKEKSYNEDLYNLGYNLGKWIYIIDALDDLKKDLETRKFNAINCVFNNKNFSYYELLPLISEKINFTLTMCAVGCIKNLDKLPIKRNHDLLYNILQYGLMEKMDKVFNGKEVNNNEESL